MRLRFSLTPTQRIRTLLSFDRVSRLRIEHVPVCPLLGPRSYIAVS